MRIPSSRHVLKILFGVAAGVIAPAVLFAVVPTNSGAIYDYVSAGLLPVTINATAGDQYHPHVHGDLAAYTANDRIRFYNFFTSSDVEVPSPPGTQDFLSDVNDGRIVFARIGGSGTAVMLYDVASGTTIEIDPVVSPLRYSPVIGSNTVAFVDFAAAPEGELFISTLGGATRRVTNDARTDQNPAVSPLGDVVVYESCGSTTCDVRQATWNGSTWVVSNLANSELNVGRLDTDGVVAAYAAVRSGERDIYWQPAGGGTEQRLILSGEQRWPSVSGGLITFESVATGETAADLFAYHIATNRLFRITSTPVDESLSDVARLPDGRFRVVWTSGDSDRDVHGATFELPEVGTFSFGGFRQPVDAYPALNVMKAGAAVPVRFSLDGFRGLDIFAADYPRSSIITCGSSTMETGVEETVTAGGSSLTYDAALDEYTYIWKTNRTWAGTCRQLVIEFKDFSRAYANFKLR